MLKEKRTGYHTTLTFDQLSEHAPAEVRPPHVIKSERVIMHLILILLSTFALTAPGERLLTRHHLRNTDRLVFHPHNADNATPDTYLALVSGAPAWMTLRSVIKRQWTNIGPTRTLVTSCYANDTSLFLSLHSGRTVLECRKLKDVNS